MLAAPKYGLVYLATRKTGSTAIQNAFEKHAQLVTHGPPTLKHLNAAEFEAQWAPLLAEHGYPRSGYETVCAVREPLDATVSWWRYRSRSRLEGHPNFAGDLSFDEFAEQVLDGRVQLTSASEFVAGGVDRIFKYDNVDRLLDWMRAKIGKTVTVGRANTSPPRAFEMSPSIRARLEEFYAGDLALYERAE